MATALEDTHDHSIITDLLGAVLGIAIGVLMLSAALAGAGLLVVRWMSALSS